MLRNRFILLFCLLSLSLLFTACGGGGGGNPVGTATTGSETASLRGTVIFANSPLANAAVYLYRSEKAHTAGMAQLPSFRASALAQQLVSDGVYSTTTDTGGNYSFVDIPVGQYTLIAVKDDNNQFVQTGVMLGSVTALDAQLTPTGKISGRVQALVGGVAQNVSGALVYVSGTSYVALTDTLGYFVINSVPSNSLTTSTPYEIRVLPGHGDAAPVTGVRVNPGATTEIPVFSLTVPAAGFAVLSGSLIPAGGLTTADVAGHFIILTNQTDGTLMGTRSNASGQFQFSVVKTGTYLVVCAEKDFNYSPSPLIVSVTTLNNSTLTLAGITVQPAVMQNTGSIVGEVTLSGLPEAGAIVHVTGTSFIGVTDASGRFVIANVPASVAPASYSLEVSSTKGSAPAKTGVIVTAGQTTNAGIFSLTRPPVVLTVGSITGEVSLSGVAEAGAIVHVTGTSFIGVTDASGRFVIANVPASVAPASYSLEVSSGNGTAPAKTGIIVTAGQNTNAGIFSLTRPLVVLTVGSITGEVSRSGLPEAGALVHVTGTSLVGVTGTNGRFIIDKVPASVAPASYSVEVSSGNGIAPAKTGIVVTAGQATDIGIFAIARPAAGYKNIVGTLTPVLPVTQAMLANRLVQLTSPDGKAVSAYSNATGGFSFITTLTGNHSVTVIDSELAYSPRTQSLNVAVLDNATLALSGTISASDPDYDPRVRISGTVVKDIRIKPETDESGVSIRLSPESALLEPLFTLSRADGTFSFLADPGTYTLTIEGLYQLNPPSPVTFTTGAAYTFASAIHVRPAQVVVSTVEGSVTWPAVAGWNFTEGEVILEGAAYVDRSIISNVSPAAFRFENVPPGAYTLRTNPLRNGYDGSMSVTVTEGNDVTGLSLTPVFTAPIINNTAVSGYTLALLGQNFGPQANMQGYVNDKALVQTGTWDTGNCYFDITALTPGNHAVELRNNVSGSLLIGNRVVFTRPVLSPLAASFVASSTDTSITFSWQNEPFVNTVEARLMQGATVAKPLQKVYGSMITFSGLQPGLPYTIEVSSTFPDLPTPAPTTFTFSTRQESINKIASFTFTGAGIATGTIFGFEVVNGVAYVGFQDSANIIVQSFDLTTNTLLNSSTPITTSGVFEMRSMAVNSSGVYLTYSLSAGVHKISSLNLSLAMTSTIDLIADLGFDPTLSMATLRSLNNRLFLVTRAGVSQPMNTNVSEINSGLAIVQSAAPLLSSTNASGKTADVAYDSVTGVMYLAYPNENYNNTVVSFNNMNLSAPSPQLAELSSSIRIYLGFYAHNNRVYLCEKAIGGGTFYPVTYTMDTRSGFVQQLTNMYSGSFGFDRQNRVWAGSLGYDIKFLLQMNNSFGIEQSLKLNNTDFVDLEIPMARLDEASGMMYMLHFNAANALSVFRYDSNF